MNSAVVEHLKKVLADSYALYLKSQNYHWNVVGPQFNDLHNMFEEHYTDLAKAIDDVAELLRGLQVKAPGSFAFLVQTASIEDGNENASAPDMVADLLKSHEKMQVTLTECLKAAQQAEDEVVCGFMGERLSVHRKTAWILRSLAAS